MTSLTPQTPIIELVARELHDKEVHDMWYDWFCSDASLVRKGRKLLTRIRAITPSPRFDATTHYAFFKNNCPMNGGLYDDFRICDIATGDVVFCVVPSEGYSRTKGQACVWGKHPTTGEFGELVRGKWSDIKAFFRESDEAKVLDTITQTARYNMITEAGHENVQYDREKRYAKWAAECELHGADREYASQLEALLTR